MIGRAFYICNPPKKSVQAARVAELVDAADSKSAVRKDVSVRFRSRAQHPLNQGVFFLPHYSLKPLSR